MPEIKWRNTVSWPKSLDTLYGGCEYFGKRIAEITDNKFQIQVFAAGEIVPGLQVLDAVQNGTVEMGNTALYYYWGKDPAFTFGTALPFGLNSRQMNGWLRFGGGHELLNELFKTYNCFGGAATPARNGRWFARRSSRSRTSRAQVASAVRGQIMTKGGSCRSSLPAATSIRRWRRHARRVRRVGPRREKLGFQKVAKYSTIRGGKAAARATKSSMSQGNELPKIYQERSSRRPAHGNGCRKYDAGNPARSSADRGARAAPFPGVMAADTKPSKEITADLSRPIRVQKLYDSAWRSPAGELYAWSRWTKIGSTVLMRMRSAPERIDNRKLARPGACPGPCVRRTGNAARRLDT